MASSRRDPMFGRPTRIVSGLVEAVLTLLVVAALAGALAVGRGALTAPSPVGGPPALDLRTVATTLEAATAKGARGFTFEVVSRSTLVARPDGPRIEVPDPADPRKTLGLADRYYVGASIAQGTVTPEGFWLQMRRGPTSADAPPDFATSEATLAALVREGVTWRNDGEGWYETDSPPGIGLDPRTVALLPRLLRNAGTPSLVGAAVVDGRPATTLAATGAIADAPGLMAIDAAGFTELTGPLEFSIDDEGRLVGLTARMRNTRSETFDLLVETVITFRYDPPPGALPDPAPLAPPPPAPPAEQN